MPKVDPANKKIPAVVPPAVPTENDKDQITGTGDNSKVHIEPVVKTKKDSTKENNTGIGDSSKVHFEPTKKTSGADASKASGAVSANGTPKNGKSPKVPVPPVPPTSNDKNENTGTNNSSKVQIVPQKASGNSRRRLTSFDGFFEDQS